MSNRTSRKLIIVLATALVAATSLTSPSADARGFGGFGGGHFGGRGFGGGHFGGARFASNGGFRGHGGGRVIPIFGRGGRGGHGGGHLIPIFGRGGGHGGLIPIRDPGPPPFPRPWPPRHPVPPIFWPGHHHWHWVFRGGVWVVVNDVGVDTVETGVVDTAIPESTASGPCTCLIKTYTPSGLVVFSDMCTKEQASAPVNANTSDASQTPTSASAAPMSPAQMSDASKAVDYDGRPYAAYLAANPGVAQALASQTAPQGPAPQSQPAPATPTGN